MDTKEKIKELEDKIFELGKDSDYYNALQLALKLVMNQSYGAFASKYFILFNNQVAGTITAEGRQLTKTMSKVNEEYWYNIWGKDKELHKRLRIKNVKPIDKNIPTSIYGDTDSIFVGFDPAIKSCDWKDMLFNEEYLSGVKVPFIIINDENIENANPNFKGCLVVKDETSFDSERLVEYINNKNPKLILSNGKFLTNNSIGGVLEGSNIPHYYNWSREIDFIHGLDRFRIGDYFKEKLDEHAKSYGVENVQDFELEKISESIINIAKKKYIQNIVWEEGIYHDSLSYYQPKGVELVRSSTPAFARGGSDNKGGIMKIITYLFANPDTFNIKELIQIVKELRREMELASPDAISMQSSCSNYNEKVISDKDELDFVKGTHFAVKAAAFHNYLLHQHNEYQNKYAFIKSGEKIKYYYCKSKVNPIFAFIRGDHPVEFAPEVDYDTQFEKAILSPINGVIEPLGLPEINKRLSVVMDIFSGLKNNDK